MAAQATSRLAGRRLLVTGASAGIGRATALAAIAAGAKVALLARRPAPLEELAADHGAVAVPADVVDRAAVGRAVDTAVDALGGLDGVINAAGLVRPARVADGDPDDWQRMLDVNVRGLLHVTQAALPALRAEQMADVVNVSSMSGRRVSSPELAVYAGSKAAVHAIGDGLRAELAADGIRVCTLAPGFVRTGIFEGQDSQTATALHERANEVGLTAEDVADRIVDVLAAPPSMVHVEVAMVSIDQ